MFFAVLYTGQPECDQTQVLSDGDNHYLYSPFLFFYPTGKPCSFCHSQVQRPQNHRNQLNISGNWENCFPVTFTKARCCDTDQMVSFHSRLLELKFCLFQSIRSIIIIITMGQEITVPHPIINHSALVHPQPNWLQLSVFL